LTNKTNPINPNIFFFSRRSCTCLRRPGTLFEKTVPGPCKNFLLLQLKGKNQGLSLLAIADHVKYNLVKEKETK
jgi:hypothetical protein